ncbi:hypothetical protein [Campylobacter sputorum]|uniref:hypothetical protein n=1 Tax=Campylobacter sputorum TaxID=206 RepID=UPI00053BDA0C|nr:hypothetical protein [Campylobacter sputorum]
MDLILITANELNINTKNNTHLKGSLIAAGYYKDNTKNSNLVFIDNKNLNLTTNTLTYENLSNTSYTKGTDLSLSANYAIKNNTKEKENTTNNNQQNSQSNTLTNQTQDINSKISSTSYSNNRNLSYNHSKTLATIEQGNLIVANTNISKLQGFGYTTKEFIIDPLIKRQSNE